MFEWLRVQLFGTWVVATIFIAIPAMLVAQVWGCVYSLRKRDWLRALVLALPVVGHIDLVLVANSQSFSRWGIGFRIQRDETRYMALFKLAYNLAGIATIILIGLVLLIRLAEWVFMK